MEANHRHGINATEHEDISTADVISFIIKDEGDMHSVDYVDLDKGEHSNSTTKHAAFTSFCVKEEMEDPPVSFKQEKGCEQEYTDSMENPSSLGTNHVSNSTEIRTGMKLAVNPGVMEPAQKRKADDENDRNNDRTYDRERRQRLFREKWKLEFQWLEHRNNSMFCSVCQVFSPDSKSKFVQEGCTNFKHESLAKHSTSKVHRKAVSFDKVQKSISAPPPPELTIKNMNSAPFSKLHILFRTCHALAKHGRPFTDMAWQCSLLDSHGINVGDIYRSEKSAQVFIHNIAKAERQHMARDLKEAKFLSIVCGSAIGSALTKDKILFVRYVKHGVINVRFLGVQSMETGDAMAIENYLEDCFFAKLGLAKSDWIKKLVGFGSDGTAVMVGCKGVIAKLKSLQPCLVGISCFNHKLELSYQAACKNVALFLKVEKLLIGLYYFYLNSPLNASMIKRIFKDLGLAPLMPTRIGSTQWLSRTRRALSNFVNGYPAFEMHLQQLKDSGGGEFSAKAKSFLTVLQNRDIRFFCSFLLDVVICLSNISLTLQDTNSTICGMYFSLERAIQMLDILKSKSGLYLREALSAEDPVFPSSVFENGKVSLLLELKESLSKQFHDVHKDVIKSLQIGNLSQWPKQFVDCFGDDSVARLATYYKHVLNSAGVDAGAIGMEWLHLKDTIYELSTSPEQLKWTDINCSFRSSCSNFLDAVDLILTLPALSWQCEKGFRIMKTMKSDWRSRLKADLVTDLLTIIMHTPPVGEYDPTDAIHVWIKSQSSFQRSQLHSKTQAGGQEARNVVEAGAASDASDSDEENINEMRLEETATGDFAMENELLFSSDDDEPSPSCSATNE